MLNDWREVTPGPLTANPELGDSVGRLVDRWLRTLEAPRLNGHVHLITQTVHLAGGLVDVDSWALDADGGICHRREYGHRSAPLARERRVAFGPEGLPSFVFTRSQLHPFEPEYRYGVWKVRVGTGVVHEIAGSRRRSYEYDLDQDRLEHQVPEGEFKGTVVSWTFRPDGGLDRAVASGGSTEGYPLDAWDPQNIQVRGSHHGTWWLEVVERDAHGNPITGYRHYMDGTPGSADPDADFDVVTWEISYARGLLWPSFYEGGLLG